MRIWESEYLPQSIFWIELQELEKRRVICQKQRLLFRPKRDYLRVSEELDTACDIAWRSGGGPCELGFGPVGWEALSTAVDVLS